MLFTTQPAHRSVVSLAFIASAAHAAVPRTRAKELVHNILHPPQPTPVPFQPPLQPGFMWSGFGVSDDDCASGDVNYVLEARIEKYPLANSAGLVDCGPPDCDPEEDAYMYTRTWVGVKDKSSPFCELSEGEGPYDGSTGPMGPCLAVNPGQTLTVQVKNRMDEGMKKLGQTGTDLHRYWELAKEGPDSAPAGVASGVLDDIRIPPWMTDSDSTGWFGSPPKSAEDMIVTNIQDLPGADVTYDDVNFHAHGLQVVPHLFYPQGNTNPSSNWITIQPASENPQRSSFCYVFDLAPDHPMGMYWYHIHRHGSVAMQGWQGMLGQLEVGNQLPIPQRSPWHELAAQGVSRSYPLLMWEWSVNPVSSKFGTNVFIEANFLEGGGSSQNFPVNNGYQPTIKMRVDETLHIGLACVQVTTGSGIYVLDESNKVVPFFVFASDGISYAKPYSHQMIVVGPGQREGMLVQFGKSGRYRLMQGVLNDFQGTGEGGAGGTIGPGPGPHGLMPGSSDQPAAFFEVIGPPVEKKVPLPDGLSLHPGMGGPDGDVQPSQISSQFGIRFQVNTLRDRAPVPQFVIGGKEFDVQSIFDVVESNSAAQWTLTSNMNYFHPFHVHVNPVQVKLVDLGSYIYGSDLFRRAINRTNAWPANMWRDTLFIPPYGAVVTWSKFNARFPGKTLFHCHFLDHEDQGMIAAFMVAQPGGFFFGASGGACISRQNAEYDTSQDTQITSAEQCEAAARSLTAGSVAQTGTPALQTKLHVVGEETPHLVPALLKSGCFKMDATGGLFFNHAGRDTAPGATPICKITAALHPRKLGAASPAVPATNDKTRGWLQDYPLAKSLWEQQHMRSLSSSKA